MSPSPMRKFIIAVCIASPVVFQNICLTDAFVTPPSPTSPARLASVPSEPKLVELEQGNISYPRTHFNSIAARSMSSASSNTKTEILSLTLEKPLGLILEENEDGKGVIVTAVNEGGSAFESPYASQLLQSKIQTVVGKDVSELGFDQVMESIIDAPSPFEIEFSISSTDSPPTEEESTDETAAVPTYEMGAPVTIAVEQPAETNKAPITLEAKVGDNLRKTLLSNKDIELYRGLKKKLGNCGGVGQCGFCAVELTDEEGVWGERSDYEAQKIGKNGSEKARLACMNNIVGPAKVRTL